MNWTVITAQMAVSQSKQELQLICREYCFKPLICSLKIMFAVLFANNVVLKRLYLQINVVSKSPCLQF
jgi:hypothetical protein